MSLDDAHAKLNSPSVTAQDLADIAASHPELRKEVASHPLAYPALLTWLEGFGDPEVNAAIAARATAEAAAPSVPAVPPQPAAPAQVPPTFAPEQSQAQSPFQPGGSAYAGAPAAATPTPYGAPPQQPWQQAPVATQPATPGVGFGETFKLLLELPLKIWRGDTEQAIEEARFSQKRTGASVYWLVVLAFAGIAAGIFAIGFVNRGTRTTNSGLDFLGDMGAFGGSRVSVGIGFGGALGIIFVAIIILILAGVFRALTFQWTLGTRGAKISFAEAVNVVALPYSLLLLPLAALALLNLIPGAGLAVLVSIAWAALGLPLTIAMEATLFVALNQIAKPTKSIIIPHAWLTLAWSAMLGVALLILNVSVIVNILG